MDYFILGFLLGVGLTVVLVAFVAWIGYLGDAPDAPYDEAGPPRDDDGTQLW